MYLLKKKMKKNVLKSSFKLAVVGLSLVVLSACASKKDIIYFQDDASLTTIYEKHVPTIQTNDMLTITVSAADMKATEAFNQQSVYITQSNNPNSQYKNLYTVSEAGTIDFPVLGTLHLQGKTRNEAITFMKSKLEDYIVDPGVNINFSNFRISVMGEVNKPGTFTLPSERITLLEALAMAGDLTIQGKRQNITVIRETNGQKNTYKIDLTKKEALNSPVYYLAQNDVVYVEPNQSRMQSSVVNYPVIISMAGIIISVISVLTR